MNFGAVMARLGKKLETAGASTQEGMWLSDHTSMWNMDLYLAVDKEVSDAENVTLSGKFLCRVFEGPYRDMRKWDEEFDAEMKNKNLKVQKKYWWYTTCPKCAKKYGKNYVVIVAKIG